MGRFREGLGNFGTYFGNNGVGKVPRSQLFWDAFGTGLGQLMWQFATFWGSQNSEVSRESSQPGFWDTAWACQDGLGNAWENPVLGTSPYIQWVWDMVGTIFETCLQ
jgi:hypothetical protein